MANVFILFLFYLCQYMVGWKVDFWMDYNVVVLFMKECMARDLVVMLVDEQKMSLHGALDALYQSETYAKLKDTRSGLYFQSPVYVYGFLRKEILTGKM
jgi:hypothetical protein